MRVHVEPRMGSTVPSICENYVPVLDLIAGCLLNDLVRNDNSLANVGINFTAESVLGLDIHIE